MKVKYLLILAVLAVAFGVYFAGCAGKTVQAKIVKYEVTDFNGRPALKVSIETNEYPVTLELLGSDRRTVDLKSIESEKDIPAIIYLGLSGQNVKGTYYLELKVGTKTLDEKEITLLGPKLQLVDKEIDVKYQEYLGYSFDRVKLTLKNNGDCPGYVYWIELTIDNGNPITSVANEYKIPVVPGETKTYTASFSLLTVKEKGKHNLKVRVADLGKNVIGEFTTTVNIS